MELIKKIAYPIVFVINWIFVSIVWLFSLPFFSKKKVFFVSYYGKSIHDNPGELFNYFSGNSSYKLVFAYNKKAEKNKNVIFVKYKKYFNPRMFFHLFTSKVIVNNSRFDFDIRKKKKQLYIQTWHGGGAQKKSEGDVIDSLPKRYIKMAMKDSSDVDVFLSDSRFMSKVFRKSYWYDGFIMEVGCPRYDALLDCNRIQQAKSKVYSLFGYDNNGQNKIVLYAPTFRQDFSTNHYDLDFELLKKTLSKRFGGDWIVFVRLHPNLVNRNDLIDFGANTVDVTNYPDSQELLAASDVVISDYSSIAYDFSLMGKPAFRYSSDLDSYLVERGFYFKFSDYPFPFATSNEELSRIILSFDSEEYIEHLNNYYSKIGQIINNRSTLDVASIIVDFLNGTKKQDLLKKYSKYSFGE